MDAYTENSVCVCIYIYIENYLWHWNVGVEFEKVKSILLITCQIQLIAYVRSFVSEEFQLLKGKVFNGVLKKKKFSISFSVSSFFFLFFFQNEPNKRIKKLNNNSQRLWKGCQNFKITNKRLDFYPIYYIWKKDRQYIESWINDLRT